MLKGLEREKEMLQSCLEVQLPINSIYVIMNWLI